MTIILENFEEKLRGYLEKGLKIENVKKEMRKKEDKNEKFERKEKRKFLNY